VRHDEKPSEAIDSPETAFDLNRSTTRQVGRQARVLVCFWSI